MVSRSSAMMSSALGPRAVENLSMKDFCKPFSPLRKILDSPLFGPKETISVSLPDFLLKAIGSILPNLTFGRHLLIFSFALSSKAGLSSECVKGSSKGISSKLINDVSA